MQINRECENEVGGGVGGRKQWQVMKAKDLIGQLNYVSSQARDFNRLDLLVSRTRMSEFAVFRSDPDSQMTRSRIQLETKFYYYYRLFTAIDSL